MLRLGLLAILTAKLLLNMTKNTITTEQLFEMIQNESAHVSAFEDKDFYQKFKSVTKISKDWNIDQKREFVKLTIAIFEGMDGWDFIAADSAQNIFELTQGKERTLECLNLLTKIFPEIPEIQKILYILSEVDRIKSRQRHPIYNLNQKPSVIFNDPGLKFAVINQLMYRQSKLKPTFDIKLFAEEYTACFINPELRGASIEAGEYFWNLDIPQHWLNKIEELYIDSQAELYKIATIYPGYFNFNMGGFIPISAKAINDLALLPNLRKICINVYENKFMQVQDAKLENFGWGSGESGEVYLSESFIQVLRERKIELCQGDTNLL